MNKSSQQCQAKLLFDILILKMRKLRYTADRWLSENLNAIGPQTKLRQKEKTIEFPFTGFFLVCSVIHALNIY